VVYSFNLGSPKSLIAAYKASLLTPLADNKLLYLLLVVNSLAKSILASSDLNSFFELKYLSRAMFFASAAEAL
jgi:hypothetical protein